jgi:alpha-ketoglutarate-dependent taurine dioxygenase
MQPKIQAQNRSNAAGLSSVARFDLADADAYHSWREAKLAAYPAHVSELMVKIADLTNPSEAERAALTDRCHKANMAIYVSRPAEDNEGLIRNDLQAFAQAIGLHCTEEHRSAAEDGIVAIEIAKDKGRKGYIPYSNRQLSWHTDGYYNAPEDHIRAFLLHCVRGAEEGGENGLLDPEIAYIRMRDENPDFVAAFMHDEAMTIPANVEDNGKIRAESIGPVFSLDSQTGTLHMRYTARGRNIVWRNTPDTQAAAKFLAGILADGDPLIFRHKLAPGQGLICNNVLHSRTGFKSDLALSQRNNRLIYRVRYFDRIAETLS